MQLAPIALPEFLLEFVQRLGSTAFRELGRLSSPHEATRRASRAAVLTQFLFYFVPPKVVVGILKSGSRVANPTSGPDHPVFNST